MTILALYLPNKYCEVCNMSTSFSSSQNDQSTGEIKVIGGDDLSTLTGKVRNMKASMIMTKTILVDTSINTINIDII